MWGVLSLSVELSISGSKSSSSNGSSSEGSSSCIPVRNVADVELGSVSSSSPKSSSAEEF